MKTPTLKELAKRKGLFISGSIRIGNYWHVIVVEADDYGSAVDIYGPNKNTAIAMALGALSALPDKKGKS